MIEYGSSLLLRYPNRSHQWLHTDSESLYQLNLQRQPESWYYRHNSVTYTWNTEGYRCPEFDQISWPTSRVIMGCSHSLGLGLTDQDCVHSHIANCVNLSQPGVSVYHIQYNTQRLIHAGIKPQRIDIIVPDLTRATYFGSQDWVDLTVHDFRTKGHALSDRVSDYYRGLISDSSHCLYSAWITAVSTRALWQSHGVDCRLWGLWFNTHSSWDHQLTEPVDLARDCDLMGTAHPGRLTHLQWAAELQSV